MGKPGPKAHSVINDLLKNLINFKVIIVDNGNNERVLKKLLHFKNIKIISQKKI